MPHVLDASGREWTVRERWTPWRPWLVLRLFRRDADLVPSSQVPVVREPMTGLDRLVAVTAHILSPELIVLGVLLSPFLLVEAVGLVVGGAVLWVGRRVGLVGRRVEVIGHSGRWGVHSRSSLVIRGEAAELIGAVVHDRVNATTSFHPDHLPDGVLVGVKVREHRSVWQSSDMWRMPH
jgi:hypothetical protein